MRKNFRSQPHGVTLGDGKQYADISMLLELADFYEVDIREIIDGERKSEQMNEELRKP